jgi:phospholipid/cholesterol/gamma-HCH transport system substrate-binding protein
VEYFRPDVKVGLFVFASLVLLAFAAITVGKIGDLFAEKQQYTVLFSNANLFTTGTRVSYAGLQVGHVAGVELRSAAARAQQHQTYPVALSLAVKSGIVLREDSRVEMKTEGFIGDRYLDIIPGTGKPVSPGSTLLGSMGGLDGMLASLSGVQGGVEGLLTSLQTLLTDASRPDSVPGTLASVNRAMTELVPRLAVLTTASTALLQHVQQEVVNTSGKAGQTLESVNATIQDNRPGLQRLVNELNTSLVEARRTMDATRQLLDTSKGEVGRLLQGVVVLVENLQGTTKTLTAQVQQLLTGVNHIVVQNDHNIYATIENLRDMTGNLEATTEQLRANPAVILWGNRGDNGVKPVKASQNETQNLRDRGRIGRYDRTP